MPNDIAPPHRCEQHADADPDAAPYCGACMSQQKIHAKWLKGQQAEEAQRERDRELERRAEQAEENQLAIKLCHLCDESGYVGLGSVCDHVDRRETHARGMALVRAELAKIAARNGGKR